MTRPRFEVRGIAYSYDRKKNVFEDISFDVGAGDVFCVLGPNGSGKSTLLRCLCNILKSSKGTVSIDGRAISTMSYTDIARRIGYIPQMHYPTFPYKVKEVVLMGRSPHMGIASTPGVKDREITMEAIGALCIEHLADRPYTEISGGEMQMVMLARVLAQQPDVLLMDEPTSHLDIGNQIRIIKTVMDLSKRGMSIVMTSHFPDHALLSHFKVGIMKGGRFTDLGPADQVITEESMKRTYGADIRIVYMGEDIRRKVCVPVIT
jgi:iron complex transport system ATP-binding protein